MAAASVTSTGASLLVLPKPSLSSTTHPPLLLTRRRPPVLRFHSLRLVPLTSPGSTRFTPVRCCVNRSGDSSSPLDPVSKFRDPPGFYDESWFVVMDKPGGEGATEQQMVDCYIQTLAGVVGSVDEALKKIYRVECKEKSGFGCVIDDEQTIHELRGLPGVLSVFPDPYVPEYKDPADTLKHLALNIKRSTYTEYKVMEGVEGDIQALSKAYKALEECGVNSTMQGKVEQVLGELSVQVKQLGSINGTTEEADIIPENIEKERAMALGQAKKAVESLSLAQEAVDSLHSDQSHMISVIAQVLSELSKSVTELGGITSQEAALSVEDRAGLKNARKNKLQNLAGQHSEVLETLSPNVRKRVEFLLEIQGQRDELVAKFLEERAALEAKYEKLYEPLYKKRYEVVNGVVEVEGVINEGQTGQVEGEPTKEKGVPNFWLTALKTNEVLAEEISERDEGPLKYLKDIKWYMIDDPKGFKLEFYFDVNPYFKNSILTKTYHMIDLDEHILDKAIGTEIEWYPGQSLTQRVLKLKPRKGSKNAKPLTMTEICESFFNFFNPPQLREDKEDIDEDVAEELQNQIEQDYDIGSTIRDKIIPHAVSWFTGEAVQGDEFEDIEDDDEEDGNDEEDEEDDEDEEEEEEDEDEDDEEEEDEQ